jgi:hypothetical protein
MTEKKLKRLCKEWQKRLRLRDWHVNLKVLPKEDMNDSFGETRTQIRHKAALIRIATGHGDDPLISTDYEQTLVHELLHLMFKGFDHLIPRTGNEYNWLEASIELLAIALVEARRGEKIKTQHV